MSVREIAERRYAQRSFVKLGQFFVDHLGAMTREGLHGKSDIAAELAWRDMEIARLREAAWPLVEALETIGAMTDDDGLERFVDKALAKWRAK